MFTRTQVKTISAKALEALKVLETELGVEFESTGASFTGKQIKFKLVANFVDTNTGEVASPEADAFTASAKRFNLDPALLNKIIKVGNTEYTVVGLKTRRPKYPVVLKRVRDGAGFKMSVAQVNSAKVVS